MKIPAVLVFLGTVILILGVIHAYLYFSFVTFLDITSPTVRRVLAVLFGFLAVSFVLASVGARVFPGTASQAFYALVSVWFGAAHFLFIASLAVWPIVAAARWLPFPGLASLPRQAAIFLYGLTAIFVIYNVANAHRLQISRLSVELENLPESWQGKRVAHLSDLHLGAYRGGGFLSAVAERTRELRPDLIVITGDLFDGSSGGQERFVEGLGRLMAPRGTFFVSGNHEVYAGREKILAAVKRAGITVLDDQLVELDGLQLIGIASPSMEGDALPAFDFAALPEYDRSRPSILLYHTPTDINGTSSRSGSSNSPYLSPHVSFSTVIEAGVSLQLSGHTHAGQFVPFTWAAERIYGGFHYGLKRIGDFQIYIHSGTGTWSAPFRSGSSSEIALITLESVH
jgi:hypothetical protein